MFFIPNFFILILLVFFPRFTGTMIISPIVGSLAGLLFWGITALCTESVHNFDSFMLFILIATGLSVFAFIFDD